MWTFLICIFHEILFGYPTKKSGASVIYGICWGSKKRLQNFDKDTKVINNFEDLGLNESLIIKLH
jgi:hypothetical protein